MAWETSDRRLSLPPDWSDRVDQVWERDHGQCRWILPSGARCPRRGAEVDHRYGRDRHAVKDLWLLCKHHHNQKTQREAYAGRTKKKRSRPRREERPPGEVR